MPTSVNITLFLWSFVDSPSGQKVDIRRDSGNISWSEPEELTLDNRDGHKTETKDGQPGTFVLRFHRMVGDITHQVTL